MPLSDELRGVPIEFRCPRCSHPMVKMGSWLKTIASFKCDGCRGKVRIGYPEKLAIFERHLKLTMVLAIVRRANRRSFQLCQKSRTSPLP